MGEIHSERQARRAERREQAAARRESRPREARPAPTEERRRNFLFESYAELKKVEWPGQSQVIQGTVVVLVACIVVGAYLYLNDQIWKEVVQKVLLGQ